MPEVTVKARLIPKPTPTTPLLDDLRNTPTDHFLGGGGANLGLLIQGKKTTENKRASSLLAYTKILGITRGLWKYHGSRGKNGLRAGQTPKEKSLKCTHQLPRDGQPQKHLIPLVLRITTVPRLRRLPQ